VGNTSVHGQVEQVFCRPHGCPPPPGARWKAAADLVWHAGGCRPAIPRVVHDGVPRGRVSTLHRAPTAGGVWFHRQSDPPHDAGTGKAATLTLDLVVSRPSSPRQSRPACIAGLRHPPVGPRPR